MSFDSSSIKLSSQVDLPKLRQHLIDFFDESELQDLCFDLDVDYEILPGLGKGNKTRELIKYFERRQEMNTLIQACIEVRPKTDWQAVVLILSDERPPFKGLQAFEEEDADLFFGREEITATLMLRLTQSIRVGAGAFLAIVGASGSGKSSLVRAGLIPVLKRGILLADGTRLTDAVNWPIHMITPSVHPLESLAESLTRDEESVTAVTTLIDDMKQDPKNLNRYINKMLADKEQRLLLFIDQFEEIFTLCDDEEERVTFINNLMGAATARKGQVVLLLTLRADFYAQCSQYENLRDELEIHQKFLGPMSKAELHKAIEKPAHDAKYTFEAGLVDTLLREVGNEPGALPLLSHALLETWKRRRGRELTFLAYNEAGGVRGAIAQTADIVYEYKLAMGQQSIAQRLFISLTEIGHGTQNTRRRAPLTELLRSPEEAAQSNNGLTRESVEEVLRVLTKERLIIVGEETAEVAHEAIIREWPKLQRWIEDNREGLRIQRQLIEDAKEWMELNEDTGALYRGVRLAIALNWAEDHEDELTTDSRRFILTSKEEEEKEEAEREAQRQQQLETAHKLAEAQQQRAEEQEKSANNLRKWANYLIGLVIVALLLAGWAAYSTNQALAKQSQLKQTNVELDIANTIAQQKTRTAEATALAAQAQAIFTSSPQASMLLAIEAIQRLESDDPRVPEAEEALWRTLSNFGGQKLTDHANMVKSIAISPDSNWLVTGGEDYVVHVYDMNDRGAEPLELSGSEGPIFTAVIAQDNDTFFTGTWDGLLYVWSLTFPEAFTILESGGGAIISSEISPDGRWLVTGSDDGIASLWDVEDIYEPIHQFAGNSGGITDVAFSPDNTQLVTGSDDGIALLWDLTDWTADPVIITHLNIALSVAGDKRGGERASQLPPGYLAEFIDGAIYGVAFTPNGEYIITAGGTPPWINAKANDYTVEIWQADDPTLPPISLTGHEGYITDVTISPDGRWLITASWDNTSRVWDMRDLDDPPIVLHGHEDFLTAVAIDPDSQLMVTGSADHSTRIWDLDILHTAPRIFHPDGAAVRTIAVTSDDRWLAAAEESGLIHLWDLNNSDNAQREIQAHNAAIEALAISPDDKWLISSDASGLVYLWEMETLKGTQLYFDTPAAQLLGHEGIVESLAVSGNGRWLVTGSYDSTARLWDLDNPQAQPIVLRGHEKAIFDVTISADNRWLATASEDGTMRLWDLNNPGVDQRILTGHAAAVTAVTISPDNQWLVSGSQDGTARIWDLSDLTAGPRVLSGHIDGILAIEISSNSQWVATAGLDNTLRLWNLTDSSVPPFILRGHTAWITDLAVSENGRWIVSASYDGTARLWDLDNPDVGAVALSGHKGEILTVVITSDSEWLITAGGDGTVRLWSLRVNVLMDLACSTAGRNLSLNEWEQYFPGTDYEATCPNLPMGT